MNLVKNLIGISILAGLSSTSSAWTVRQYEFNDSLAEVGGGMDAAYMEGKGTAIASKTAMYADSIIGGETARVGKFNKDGLFKITHNFNANGVKTNGDPAQFVNQYTIIADVKFDGPGRDGYISYYQTNTNNDYWASMYFLKKTGGWVAGVDDAAHYGTTTFDPMAWHRYALVVDNTLVGDDPNTWEIAQFDFYIDGTYVGTGKAPGYSYAGPDGRWALGSAGQGNPWTYMFADLDGYTSSGLINSLVFVDGLVSSDQIAQLGGASATGIGAVPEPMTLVFGSLGFGLLALRKRNRK